MNLDLSNKTYYNNTNNLINFKGENNEPLSHLELINALLDDLNLTSNEEEKNEISNFISQLSRFIW